MYPLLLCLLVGTVLFAMQGSNKSSALRFKPYFEDVNLEFLNDSYIDKDTFDLSVNYKPQSLNTLTIHIDVIEDLPEDTMIKVDISTRALGHTVPTGISFHSKLCASGHAKYFYDLLIVPLGVEGCPPKKGTYVNEDFEPDFSKININLIPGTQLLADTKIYYEDFSILELKAFIVA